MSIKHSIVRIKNRYCLSQGLVVDSRGRYLNKLRYLTESRHVSDNEKVNNGKRITHRSFEKLSLHRKTRLQMTPKLDEILDEKGSYHTRKC